MPGARARHDARRPGEPSNVSAVEYRAPSGALVFSTGTMEWALTSTRTPPIDQATYNVLSEMGVAAGHARRRHHARHADRAEPAAGRRSRLRRASITDRPVRQLRRVGLEIPNATITDYKWDLDNSGKFATDTGTTSTYDARLHNSRAPTTCILKVTDSKGQQETTARTVNVANTATAKHRGVDEPGRRRPERHAQRAPARARVGGTITDYKWDLDGNGTYETDTGSSADRQQDLREPRHDDRRPCRSPTATARPRPRRCRSR